MAENDDSWFQEDSSWRKTTTHGGSSRTGHRACLIRPENDPASLTSVAKAMGVKKLRWTSKSQEPRKGDVRDILTFDTRFVNNLSCLVKPA
jgi:hypothetical protein